MKIKFFKLLGSILFLSIVCLGFKLDDGNKIIVTKIINVPIEKVWKVLATDFDAIEHSHNKIVKAEYVGEINSAKKGAVRKVELDEDGAEGRYIIEEIVLINEVEKKLLLNTIEVNDLPLVAEKTSTLFQLEDLGAGNTKINCIMKYETSPAFLGSMMKGKMKANMMNYFISLEHFAKTGESVNRSNFDRISKLYK